MTKAIWVAKRKEVRAQIVMHGDRKGTVNRVLSFIPSLDTQHKSQEKTRDKFISSNFEPCMQMRSSKFNVAEKEGLSSDH